MNLKQGKVATIRVMDRKGKYLIVAAVVDEQGKWLYTRPVADEPVFEDRAAAQARAQELDVRLAHKGGLK